MNVASIDVEQVRTVFARIAQGIEAAGDELTRLDAAMGDGDLGVSLKKGFTMVAQEAAAFSGDDAGALLLRLGMTMNRYASSTMGTLLSTGMVRAGRVLAGKRQVSATDMAAALEAVAAGMQERGKAQPGDKTILDALIPAAQAFREAVTQGRDLAAAWAAALQAAEAGLARTAEMPSKVGRSGWFGEKTVGTPDPGAYAWVVIMRAVQSVLAEATAQI